MKLTKYIIPALIGACGLLTTSCNDWLDVNTNPNTPTNAAAEYYQRLAHIQFYTNHAINIAGRPTEVITGDIVTNARTGTYGILGQWQFTAGTTVYFPTTTAYQWWYVGAACNLNDLISSAEKAEAYHYIGAAYVIKALGFALMNDLHGELPYNDALGENVTPFYDTGKEMFEHVLADLETGIEYLSMTQGPNAVALSANDAWGNGDVNKWIKFAYFLKARQLNKLSKKGNGSAADLKYDPAAILASLDKAMQSNSDNMTYRPTDTGNTPNDNLGWAEPTDWSGLFSVIGMNSGYYFPRTVYENLTNFGGYGVEDPRADKILTWAHANGQDATSAYQQTIKYSDNGLWRRTIGIDMVNDTNNPRLLNSGVQAPDAFVNGGFAITAVTGHDGDTVFIDQRSRSVGFQAQPNMFRYVVAGNDNSTLSGTFYTRATSPHFIGSYSEACFIRAEVLFNQGNKSEAFTAYKNGIKANIDAMNEQLNVWVNQDSRYATCPSFTPMEQADIDNFLNNGIGTAADITLGKIMTQKRIAMSFSPEKWNDMRRYDYDPEIFLNWKVPGEYYLNGSAQLNIPMGKYPRRAQVSSHEFNYNTAQLNAIGEKVPGATMTNGSYDGWWNAADMWTIPVWWDSNQN
ncbi:MAG: SusD/RagB family nutrient-binding outer membrane lipoprotein [Muribaculaceae bacterium]|nr:SusD/RagB family nutrient-binding outer membrane lipoprotein [Muribaculaceae bacterium]